MSEKTPVELAEEQLDRSHWDGQGCGTHGTSACTFCFGPSPMSTAEVVERVLTSAVQNRAGLAAILAKHYLLNETGWYQSATKVRRACACGYELEPEHFAWRHFHQYFLHQADMVANYLTGSENP